MFTSALDGYDVLKHPNVQMDDEQADDREGVGDDARDGNYDGGDGDYYNDGVM